ncbi:hypothetical protein V8D89_001291 [Ganoderma adspersum]
MSARANTLSPPLVAYASLRKLMKEAPVYIPPPSRRIDPPNLERDFLTFLAAVCGLRPDCDGAAVAVARAATPSLDTTLYVATDNKSTPALQHAFVRFVHDLRAAYRCHGPHATGACENPDVVVLAVYRFAYPFLRECLWDDARSHDVSPYIQTEQARSIQHALKELKDATKETDAQAIAPDRGSVADDFLSDITSAFVVATHLRFAPIVSGACLSDDEVGSLMHPEGTPTPTPTPTDYHEWAIRWIDPLVLLAAFEAELSASAIAVWLEEYSQSSRFLPWDATIVQIAACCPDGLTKTGERYTMADDEPAQVHCEIALLVWLVRHRVPVDMHIGCSGYACWLCVEFAKALGSMDPDGGYASVALSDIFDHGSVELPWVCPADTPDAAVEALRDAVVKAFCWDAAAYVSRDFEQDSLELDGTLEWYYASR